MNNEFYSNYILAIYHDSKLNKLALLKARYDCTIYIVVVDMLTNDTEIINTNLYIEAHNIRLINYIYTDQDTFLKDDLLSQNGIINIKLSFENHFSYDGIVNIINHTGEIKTYQTAGMILAFEVDFEKGLILIEAPITSITVNETTLDQKEERLIFIYDKTTEKTTTIEPHKGFYPERLAPNFVQFLNDDTIIYLGDGDFEDVLFVVNLSTKEASQIDLDDCVVNKRDKNFGHEYAVSFIFKKSLSYVAYTLIGPTGGYIGIRILKIDFQKLTFENLFQVDLPSNSSIYFEPSYMREEYDFCSIDINFLGNKTAVFYSKGIYNEVNHSAHSINYIYIYDTINESLPPQIINIDCPSQTTEIHPSGAVYFISDTILFIIFDTFFSFYNITGEKIKDISYEKLNRYHVSEKYITYSDRNKLCMIYADDNGNITQLNLSNSIQ